MIYKISYTMLYIVLFFVLCTQIVHIHAVEDVVIIHPCDQLYQDTCILSFKATLPNVGKLTKDSIIEDIVLPFNLRDHQLVVLSKANEVGGNMLKKVGTCELYSNTAQTTTLRLKPALWYELDDMNIQSDQDVSQFATSYLHGERFAECIFQFNNNQNNNAVSIFGHFLPSQVVSFDVTKFTQTAQYVVTSIDNLKDIMLPPFIRIPSTIGQVQMVEKNSICYNQFHSADAPCVFKLENLPTTLFPMVLNTMHELILSELVQNTSSCPLIIQQEVNIGYTQHDQTSISNFFNPTTMVYKNRYVLTLPPDLDTNSIHVVSCDDLSVKKSTTAGFTIYKELNVNLQHQQLDLMNQNNKVMIYDNPQISRNAIETKMMSDCYSYYDSRCTFVILFPDDDYAVMHDMIMSFDYLDPAVYFNSAQQIPIAENQKKTYASWISPILPLPNRIRPTSCVENQYYMENALNLHQTRNVKCVTFRKSIQAHNPDPTALPQEQLLRFQFFGELITGQYNLIHFTSAMNTVFGEEQQNLPLSQITLRTLNLNSETHVFTTSPLTFTTPLRIAWDRGSCGNSNVPFCKAIITSKMVGAPVSINFAQNSDFLEHHTIERYTCNTANIGIDPTTHTIKLPSDNLLKQKTEVLLIDPYTNNAIKQHECIVYYTKPYSSSRVLQYNNPNINFEIDTTTTIARSTVVSLAKSDGLLQLQDDIEIQQTIHTYLQKQRDEVNPPSGGGGDDDGDGSTNSTSLFLIQQGEQEEGQQTIIQNNINDYGDDDLTIILPSVMTFFMPSTPSGSTIDYTKVPNLFDAITNVGYNPTNLASFLFIDSIYETTQRIHARATVQTLHHHAHLPLFFIDLTDIVKIPTTPIESVTAMYNPNELSNNDIQHQHVILEEEDDENYIDLTWTFEYHYKLTFSPLILPYHVQLINITKQPNCDDTVDMYCTFNITYPSYQWLVDNDLKHNTLDTFTIFFDGADHEQNYVAGSYGIYLDNTTEIFNGLLDINILSVEAVSLSYDELQQQLGIQNPIKPMLITDALGAMASLYFVEPPTFDPTKKQFVAFTFTLSPQHHNDLNNNPYFKNPNLSIFWSFQYRKTIQYYFRNEYANAKIYLLSWGGSVLSRDINGGNSNLFNQNISINMNNTAILPPGNSNNNGGTTNLPQQPTQFNGANPLWWSHSKSRYFIVLEQPPQWVTNFIVSSQFQPEYVIQFDEACEDPSYSQCRVFVCRPAPVQEMFFFTLDLKTFSLGNAWFLHSQFDQGQTRIYYAMLPAGLSLVPLSFPVRPLDTSAQSATIRSIQFDSDSAPFNIQNPEASNLIYSYSFFGRFPYSDPIVPQIQNDCTSLSDRYCTIHYSMNRPIYAQLDTSSPFTVAMHNLTSRDYIYIPAEKLQLLGTERPDVLADYYYFADNVSWDVIVDGDVNHRLNAGLTKKIQVQVRGSKHPDHINAPLRLTVQISQANQHPMVWFGADRNNAIMTIRVRLEKTSKILPKQYRTRPQTYQSMRLLDPGMEVKGLRPITYPTGMGFAPVQWFSGDDCRVAPHNYKDYSCTLKLVLSGSRTNPIKDLTRVLPLNHKPYHIISPTVVYLHTIPIPFVITSDTDESLREQYRAYECGNFTQGLLNFTIHEDLTAYGITNNRLTRPFVMFQINEAYQTKTTTCHITFKFTKTIELLWERLYITPEYNWLNSLQDFFIAPQIEIAFNLNRNAFTPPNLYPALVAGGGSRYEFTDEVLPQLGFANEIVIDGDSMGGSSTNNNLMTINRFKQIFIDEIKHDFNLPVSPYTGVQQFPEYAPRFKLKGAVIGPIMQVLELSFDSTTKTIVQYIKQFAKDITTTKQQQQSIISTSSIIETNSIIDDVADKDIDTTSQTTQTNTNTIKSTTSTSTTSNSNNNIEEKYVLYQYKFTSNLGHLEMDTQFLHTNDLTTDHNNINGEPTFSFPCISLPITTSTRVNGNTPSSQPQPQQSLFNGDSNIIEFVEFDEMLNLHEYLILREIMQLYNKRQDVVVQHGKYGIYIDPTKLQFSVNNNTTTNDDTNDNNTSTNNINNNIPSTLPLELNQAIMDFKQRIDIDMVQFQHKLSKIDIFGLLANNPQNTNNNINNHLDNADLSNINQQHLQQTPFASSSSLTTFTYGTTLYLNQHKFINTQLISPSWYTEAERNEDITTYVDEQYGTNLETTKTTTKNKSCYFWAPLTTTLPTQRYDVEHIATVVVARNETLSTLPIPTSEHYNVNMKFSYHSFTKSASLDAQITSIKSSAKRIVPIRTLASLDVDTKQQKQQHISSNNQKYIIRQNKKQQAVQDLNDHDTSTATSTHTSVVVSIVISVIMIVFLVF